MCTYLTEHIEIDGSGKGAPLVVVAALPSGAGQDGDE